MNKQPTRFTITCQFMEKTKARLEALFYFAEPHEQFRFVTFERNDYAEHKLTALLFDFFPASVFVTVPQQFDLDDAVEEVKQFNPTCSFEKMPLSYFDEADLAHKRKTQELRIIMAPMRVDR
ncbi:MAG: hypothetical protein ABJB86_24320, partial [Bacteroidota bacterium]